MKRLALIACLSAALAGCAVTVAPRRMPPERHLGGVAVREPVEPAYYPAPPPPVRPPVVVVQTPPELVVVYDSDWDAEGIWYDGLFYEGAVYVPGDWADGEFSDDGYRCPYGVILGARRVRSRRPDVAKHPLPLYRGRVRAGTPVARVDVDVRRRFPEPAPRSGDDSHRVFRLAPAPRVEHPAPPPVRTAPPRIGRPGRGDDDARGRSGRDDDARDRGSRDDRSDSRRDGRKDGRSDDRNEDRNEERNGGRNGSRNDSRERPAPAPPPSRERPAPSVPSSPPSRPAPEAPRTNPAPRPSTPPAPPARTEEPRTERPSVDHRGRPVAAVTAEPEEKEPVSVERPRASASGHRR